jgi:hypothetical protein
MPDEERQPLTADEFDRQVERSHDSTVSPASRARARVNLRDAYSDVLARAVTAEAALAATQKELNEQRMMTDKIGPGLLLAGSSPAAEAEPLPCACEDADWDVHDEGCAASGVSDTREADCDHVWEPITLTCLLCGTKETP